jgi:hypothetical protein
LNCQEEELTECPGCLLASLKFIGCFDPPYQQIIQKGAHFCSLFLRTLGRGQHLFC